MPVVRLEIWGVLSWFVIYFFLLTLLSDLLPLLRFAVTFESVSPLADAVDIAFAIRVCPANSLLSWLRMVNRFDAVHLIGNRYRWQVDL